jgi:hypothetical protein
MEIVEWSRYDSPPDRGRGGCGAGSLLDGPLRMTNAAVQAPLSPDPLPAELHELALELALVIQKRAMYPGGHPMLRGAIDALVAKMRMAAELWGSVTIAVTADQVLIEGWAADAGNPILREFASHLRAHQLAAVRMLPGADVAEVDDLITTLATSARRVDRPLGTLGDDALYRWRHLALYPLTFDALELRDREAADLDVPETIGRLREVWADLTRAALGDVIDPEGTPELIADAISRRAANGSYSRDVLAALLRAASEVREQDSLQATSMRRRLSELIATMSSEALARLLEMGGDANVRARFLQQSMDVLGADALVRLVVAGGAASGASISRSMIRLLSKLSRNADAGRAMGTGADPELRRLLQRLTEHWTLDDPNPGEYSTVLHHLSRRGAADAVADQARDQCEPDRVVELSLDADQAGEATERALSRMVVVHGLAEVLDRLAGFPSTALREQLIDSLVSGSMLREQLAAEYPDHRVLQHAVSRLRGAAVEPLLDALEARADTGTDFLADLLVTIGIDSAPPLAARLATTARQVQTRILAILDRLDAWPDTAYLQELGRHPDAALRREAVRLLLKHHTLRDDAIMFASADEDLQIFSLVLAAALKHPTARTAEALMRRVDADPHLNAELRGRAVRAVAASASPDGMRWIVGRVVARHWLTRRWRLKRKSPETVAAIAGLAVHWSDSPDALRVLGMAQGSRDSELRRAATLKPAGR